MSDLEYHRKQAKRLARAYRDGEPEATERVERLLGARGRARFQLSDAQHVVALEQGDPSWPALRRRVAVDESVVDTGRSYRPGEPVVIAVRRRGRRYDLDDSGDAVAKAGKPPGWREVAERVVAEEGMNVSRAGVVFVQVVEGRDVAAIVGRLAETCVLVYDELLDLPS